MSFPSNYAIYAQLRTTREEYISYVQYIYK